MKIAILTPTFNKWSGIDRIVELQAEEFINQGHDVTIFALQAEMKPKRAQLVIIGITKNLTIQRIERLFYFLNYFKTKKYGNMLDYYSGDGRIYSGYDKVISHLYPMNLFAMYAKKKYGTHYIYWNHGVAYPHLFRSFTERVYMHIFRFLTNVTIKKADKIVSISNYLKNELKKETGQDSDVVYDKIDTTRFHKNVPSQKNPTCKPYCLYVGRISPHKGVHLLIQAFNLVLKHIPEAELYLAGKKTFGSYADELDKLAKVVDPSKIHFLDFVPDEQLPSYYTDAEVYVTASQWEGFNMTIKEANACGTPAVAFDIGPHKEVLTKGELVPNGDIAKFAEAIIRCIGK